MVALTVEPVVPAVPTENLLTTTRLTKTFGGLHAVRAVDFTLTRGEVHALIGPNGAGKTTLVSLLSGQLAATAGQITFAGRDITALPAWRRVRRGLAYTFQITNLYVALSVYDNLAIAAQGRLQSQNAGRWPARRATLQPIIHHCLAEIGLTAWANHRAGTLAYGHQRLLEIGMGLALQPRLLILDEPTQGLAAAEIAPFIRLIEKVRRYTTLLLIEHNMAVVMRLATRLTVLHHGQILARGTPTQIQNNPAVQAAYLGHSPASPSPGPAPGP